MVYQIDYVSTIKLNSEDRPLMTAPAVCRAVVEAPDLTVALERFSTWVLHRRDEVIEAVSIAPLPNTRIVLREA